MPVAASLLQILRGPFNFLRRDPEEIHRILPDAERVLPPAQRIYLDEETATPLSGFPVLIGAELLALEQALESYIVQEEDVQLAIQARQSFDRTAYANSWERYRQLLARATENAVTSSYGRHYPSVLWLHHSLAVARVLKETPKRLLRRDLTLGREHGDEIKYKVLFKYLDRVFNLTYDLVNRTASDTDEVEEEIFPALMTRMRDNVLVLSEDHISPNLAELSSYFNGYLHIDGRDLRHRLSALAEWHAEELRSDRDLRAAVQLVGSNPDGDPRDALNRLGYVSYLASRPHWDPSRLLGPRQVQVWESLLLKLKEYELLHAVRRLTLAVEHEDDHLVCRDRSLVRFGVATQTLRLSASTRPMDFMAPWVVDPEVQRFGLIYDISDFTEIVTMLQRSGTLAQDRSFRMMFLFQRRVNRLAQQYRAKMEKYLGDGAFFSSREARLLLALAVQIQRQYRQALAEGFPFGKGLRLALNHGQYRLLPIQSGLPGEGERYEFFGHGVVELTRLTSGKTTREIEEIKTMMIARGYPEATVNRFFAPMTQHNVDIVDKREESRDFYSYINQNGNLVNEGIVATGEFISHLGTDPTAHRLFRVREDDRLFIGVRLELPVGPLLVGLRKLGLASLKGLGRLPIYEVVDGGRWGDVTLVELAEMDLMSAIEREFAASFSGSEPEPEAEAVD